MDHTKVEENADWILESLVSYLSSPVWNVPILNFMEQKSVVFEGTAFNEDHEPEYRRIHEEFRNLVDVMLGAYMEDMGLQPEDLEQALTQIRPSVRSAALQEVIEPVKAAGDFRIFKEMMKLKNEQLHYQALEAIMQRKLNFSVPELSDEPDVLEQPDDIEEAIKQSLAEQEMLRNAIILEERDVERAMAISVANSLTNQIEENSIQLTVEESQTPAGPVAGASSAMMPNAEDVERRRSLLRAQRDKILSKKRIEREIELEQPAKGYNPTTSVPARPKSGKVARAALAGQLGADVDERTIQYRRLIMQKIREEVDGSP